MYENNDDKLWTESRSSVKSKFKAPDNAEILSFDIAITISSHKKVSTNMETFILYNIDTSGSKGSFSVERRYGDFEWLSQLLTERYSMAIVPPIPPKHNVATLERFMGEFIDLRQTALCHFLKRLISHPIMGLDPDYWGFLSLSPLAFSELRKSRPILGKLEILLQSLQGLTSVAGTANGGCVDNLYKVELEKSVETTNNIGSLLRGLERVVHRSSENLSSIGQVANKSSPLLKNWTMLSDLGAQYVVTGEAVKNKLEPWVHEYGLYCCQAEKAARRRESIEAKFVTNQSKVAQGKGSGPDSVQTSHQLHDTLSRCNADLKSEFDRWQLQQSCETRDWLATFADIHVEHYHRLSDIWRQFMSTINNADDTMQ